MFLQFVYFFLYWKRYPEENVCRMDRVWNSVRPCSPSGTRDRNTTVYSSSALSCLSETPTYMFPVPGSLFPRWGSTTLSHKTVLSVPCLVIVCLCPISVFQWVQEFANKQIITCLIKFLSSWVFKSKTLSNLFLVNPVVYSFCIHFWMTRLE